MAVWAVRSFVLALVGVVESVVCKNDGQLDPLINHYALNVRVVRMMVERNQEMQLD